MSVTPLPSLDRTDPSFKTDVDDFFANKLPTFSAEVEALRLEVLASEADAATSASTATTQAGTATTQAGIATTEAATATTQAGIATTQAGLAAASAASAVNSPGTSATSTTSLTIGAGAQSLTIQTGKAFTVGQTVVIARTSAPTTTQMTGIISAYNSGTGALSVTVASGATSGSGTFTDWTISLTGIQGIPGINAVQASVRTSNTILGAADSGTLIDVTSGTFTQTIGAAAGLSGFWCYYRNRGTGTVTIDPNGSETIDGVTSGTVPPGMTILIQCNGTAHNCVRIGGPVKMEVLTSGTSWTCPLGVRSVHVRGVGGGGGTDVAGGCYVASGGGYFESWRPSVPGTAYSYAIGAGGGTTAPCTGGLTGWDSNAIFGNGGTSNNNVSSLVTGGTAVGQIAISGGVGFLDDSGSAGIGGSTPLGQGGASRSSGPSKVNPSGYGSGASSTAGLSSVAGQPGVIILEY